jgi:hypothetical protein
MPATRWSSHKDLAAKALKKLAGPHVPTSLSKLEQAVKRAHNAYDKAETAAPASSSTPSDRPSRPSPTTAPWTTSSTRTSTTPRSRRRPPAGRLATQGWHALAGVRVAGDRPASGAGPKPQKEHHDGPPQPPTADR